MKFPRAIRPLLVVTFVGLTSCGTSTSNPEKNTATTESVPESTKLPETTTTEETVPETTTTAFKDATVFETLDDRGWKLFTKNPDAMSGTGLEVHGLIIQFDARTGTDTFKSVIYRSAIAREQDYSLTNMTISDIYGGEAMLADFVQGDKFVCKCTVVASQEYTTQNQETRLSIIMKATSVELEK